MISREIGKRAQRLRADAARRRDAISQRCERGIGGAERDRTAGLLVANEALSQLSYSPTT